MRAVYLKDKDGNKLVSVPYYRVGDLFLTTIATNPSSFLGGTWELFGPGRCLVCVDTSQSEFNSVKKTGGEKTHKLTVNEMPSHSFNGYLEYPNGNVNVPGWSIRLNYVQSSQSVKGGQGIITETLGKDSPHNNLQPFITCYVWIRTA